MHFFVPSLSLSSRFWGDLATLVEPLATLLALLGALLARLGAVLGLPGGPREPSKLPSGLREPILEAYFGGGAREARTAAIVDGC